MKDPLPNKVPPNKPFQIDASALLTIIAIILLFSTAIIATLIAPHYVDRSWTAPSSSYQLQMYEFQDPDTYISNVALGENDLQYVHHLKDGFSLLAFQESDYLKLVSAPELSKYITHQEEKNLKLTSRLLLLRTPGPEWKEQLASLHHSLQEKFTKQTSDIDQPTAKVAYQILELYDPLKKEAFSHNPLEGVLQDWVDQNFTIVDQQSFYPHHQNKGVIYIKNPREYRIKSLQFADKEMLYYDPDGQPFESLKQLLNCNLDFHSRKDLIHYGEEIYAMEGCWYCHTDQTRTLIQDVVANGSDSYPAPPSSPNEYIYQKVTFLGTRRIGPDLSRTGIKRPSREWHMAHFWDPKIASQGSIMPSFKHFFNLDSNQTSSHAKMGSPNLRFEAIYQYLMTKGTRITPPTQAWWIGKDPVQTKEIIEGRKVLK